MTKITILGCCRQQPLCEDYEVTSIYGDIAFCHNTKEMLEIIKYCKYGHLPPEETVNVFAHPITRKIPLVYNEKYKTELEDSEIFVIEISSKKNYKYDDKYYSHLSVYVHDPYLYISDEVRSKVVEEEQTYDEIYQDILEIKKQLNNKPIVIVTHLVTINSGTRYELCNMLEDICKKESIPIINPIKEFTSRGYYNNLNELIQDDGRHYKEPVRPIIKNIYNSYISSTLNKNI